MGVVGAGGPRAGIIHEGYMRDIIVIHCAALP